MHIPDNYLSPSTCGALWAIMLPVWKKAVSRVREEVTRKRMPMLGIAAAFSFLIMMFNIPLPYGTTGHAIGSTLIAILLGPYAASISITAALFIQAVLFGDGGLFAFAANCFNMAFIMPFAGYYIFKFISARVKSDKAIAAAVFISAYLSVNLSALFTAIEFGLQPILFHDGLGRALYSPYPISIAVPAMLIPHLLVVGIVEGTISVGVYKFLQKVSPTLFYEQSKRGISTVYGILVLMMFLTPIGLLATGTAFGEWDKTKIGQVAVGGKALGYTPKGMEKGFDFKALFSSYKLEGMPQIAAYILSAFIGAALLLIVFKLINRNSRNNEGI